MTGIRSFESGLDTETWNAIQHGTMQTRYRGRRCLKSPFDLTLYLQLLQRLRPATVFEIGVDDGGSALWFADMLAAHGCDARVVGVDRNPPTGIEDPNVTLLTGDANRLSDTISAELLNSLPHPWLVIDDSSHFYATCLAVMTFFDPHLMSGDYLVIEDGVVESLPGLQYRQYESGPNHAVATFLDMTSGQYEIDTSLCDFYGPNVTYNPNGWLRHS